MSKVITTLLQNRYMQLNYHSVPKPWDAGLKAYIENLYNKGLIINS